MTAFRKNIPFNTTGPSYQSRSRPLASQESKMFYPQVAEEGKDNFVLHSFYGLKKVGLGAGPDRGMHNFAEVGYRIAGTKLQSFDKLGNHTDIGNIPGTQRMIMADDGANLIIVGEDGQFIYDGSTISSITDANIVGSTSATFLNSQIIYGNTSTNLYVVANPNDPANANGLNAARAESDPDELVRTYAFQQNVYMFGTRTVEPYWNPGVGNPPIERLDGQIIQVGTSAIHSPANTDEALYWLGDDNAIYFTTGGQRQRISTAAISNAIEGYSTTDDAIGYTFTIQGMNFYALTFPAAGKTWCVNESLGNKGWFELSSGTEGGIYQGSSLINVYGKNFVADKDNGNLYELDRDTFTNNGEAIQRRRVTSTIDSRIFGIGPGAEVQASTVKFIMETGVGLIEGQGENPKIQFEVSFDGGRSWTERGWGDVGRLGEYTIQVEMDLLDIFYEMMIRLTTSDPIQYSIYSASGTFRLTGQHK